jgi:FkbM family methyltransferase
MQGLLAKAGYDVLSTSRWGFDLMRDVKRLVDAKIILDVGANRGQAAAAFMAAFPAAKVYSFEPNPAALAQLRACGAEVIQSALGAADGSMTLNIPQDDVGASLLPWAHGVAGQHGAWTVPAGELQVPVKRLDDVCGSLGIAAADILKVDTQGFDLEVLRGAGDMLRKAAIRVVQVEMNFTEYYQGQGKAADVLGMLIGRGYKPVGFYPGARDGGAVQWADALFA